MEKTYSPKTIESHWSDYWEKQHLAKPRGNGAPYCIMLPPPNVTGTLHMGHGFQQTLMDALIRHQRMLGAKTLWQGGTDHAGIATQMVVEQQLSKENISRHDLGRERFVERVWRWRDQYGNKIVNQMRRLGVSIDWSCERFSMDETVSRATSEAFIRLYEEGLIYRGKRLVNWDPILHTAISDLEVETEESQGHLWHIRYPLSDGSSSVTVATTRPETMLGDVAVAVHPDDERYQHLIGKAVQLPLADRTIPIIADEHVDKEFGTGCVKITPAHDFNDYEMGHRHQLPMITIMNFDAHLNDSVPEAYRGLDRFDARKKIVADLEQHGFLEKTEDHTLSIPRGERSGAIVEPMLTDQWFVKMETLAKPAIDVVNSGELNFIPKKWHKTYLQWLENIQDWCISRQLWWGHRIPVWYDKQNNIYVGRSETDIRQKHKLDPTVALKRDSDVLDTWFSASLWPFATLGWPEKSDALKTFYPTQTLVTGFDIIFFWVARMVMMGLKLTGKIPFKEVYIHGLIRDSQGKKMSKSKGNTLDPIDLIDGITLADLIEKRTATLLQPKMAKSIENQTRKEFPHGIASYGTDALRFTFCALASTGRDINFDMGRIEGYRNFCNKIWNAARFVIMNTEDKEFNPEKPLEYSLADSWIRSRLQDTIARVEKAFEQYRFDLLAQALYEFTWNEYCDWYLELSKCVLNDENAKRAQHRGTRVTLLEVLESLLRLIHPIMPFITEEIWQKISSLLGKSGKTIMLQPYPKFVADEHNKAIESEVEWLKEVIIAIRTIRSEMGISPAKKIPIIFNKGTKEDRKRAEHCERYIKTLAKVGEIRWANTHETLTSTATNLVNQLEIHIPLAGLIDKNAELARLQKEMTKLETEQQKSAKKLDNPNYVNKAPSDVVEKERAKLEQAKDALEKLKEQYTNISSMQ